MLKNFRNPQIHHLGWIKPVANTWINYQYFKIYWCNPQISEGLSTRMIELFLGLKLVSTMVLAFLRPLSKHVALFSWEAWLRVSSLQKSSNRICRYLDDHLHCYGVHCCFWDLLVPHSVKLQWWFVLVGFGWFSSLIVMLYLLLLLLFIVYWILYRCFRISLVLLCILSCYWY